MKDLNLKKVSESTRVPMELVKACFDVFDRNLDVGNANDKLIATWSVLESADIYCFSNIDKISVLIKALDMVVSKGGFIGRNNYITLDKFSDISKNIARYNSISEEEVINKGFSGEIEVSCLLGALFSSHLLSK